MNESGARQCIAGLFHDDSRAEAAVDELKTGGFSESEIGVATANTQGQARHSGFWSKVTGILGREEHTGSPSELEGSLESCGIPDQQARYFNQALAGGDTLVTVHAASMAQRWPEGFWPPPGQTWATALLSGTQQPRSRVREGFNSWARYSEYTRNAPERRGPSAQRSCHRKPAR